MANNFLPFVFLVIVAFGIASGKPDQKCSTVFKGCNIEKGQCVCGQTVDCQNPYPYKDESQCQKDIKGDLNKCKKDPCVHGQCVQSTHDHSRRWECSCSGSGYYGKKCELKCPPFDKAPLPGDYPTDCIYWGNWGSRTMSREPVCAMSYGTREPGYAVRFAFVSVIFITWCCLLQPLIVYIDWLTHWLTLISQLVLILEINFDVSWFWNLIFSNWVWLFLSWCFWCYLHVMHLKFCLAIFSHIIIIH